ncbi:ABC transporter substrate-binding protein [Sphingomonas cavernae]|nr:ABC transporter substrate-binding protein [Sphingomonas cavernae]
MQPAQAGEVLRIGVVGQISGTHPNITASGNTLMLSGLAARGLTYFDGDVSMACLLCETLPTVENGLVRDDVDPDGKPGQRVMFRLKPGLKWDDGKPITASDFVRAWRVGREPENDYAWQSRLAEEIWAAVALDERTFEVRRRGRSCAPSDFRFMPVRGDGGAADHNPKSYRAQSPHMTSPLVRGLYVGPYRVTDYRPDPENQVVTLDRNTHWSGGRPRFDRIELVYRPTPQAMQQAVAEGLVDLVTDTRPAIAEAGMRLAPDRFVDFQRAGRTLMQVTLNLDDPALSDVRVRRALLLALDRNALAGLVSGKAAPARSFLSENFPAYLPSLAEGGLAAMSEAAKLLETSGWRAGADGVRRDSSDRPLAFRLAVARALLDGPLVQSIVESWRGVGVRVDVEPWGGIAQLTGANPPSMALFGYTIEGGANIDFHIFASHSIPKPGEARNGLNIFRYRSAAVDAIVAQLREGCAPERLTPGFRDLQRHIGQDLPLLPLFFMPEAHLLPRALALPDAQRVQLLLTQEIENWQIRD